jgi:hypothetical protein
VVNTRLEVDGVSVGYNQLLPISTNYQIADIYEPEKRNSAYSKTITIPGTKEINQVFEFEFEINAVTSSFNPNLKVDAVYYVNEIDVFRGSIRLIKVKKVYDGGQFVRCDYDCQLIGNTGSFFLAIYDKFLTDVDFSDLDHNFQHTTNHLHPTGTSPRPSYFYPMIDYGYGGGTGRIWGYISGSPSSSYQFENLKPAIFEDVYWARIFSDVGYTYSDDFIGQSYHSKIFIPSNLGTVAMMTESDRLDNQIYVGRTSNTSGNFGGTYIGGANAYWQYLPLQVVPNNVDNASGFNDIGGNYNTATYVFTQAITGYYNLNAGLNFTIELNEPAGTVTTSGTASIYVDLQRSTDSGATWTSILANYVTPTITGSTTTGTVTVNIPGTYFVAGTQWRVITNSTVLVNYKDAGAANITTGTSSVDFYFNSGSYLSAQITLSELQYGNNVDMNSFVPTDVRQIDFITSIIKRENLYMDVDKQNDLNYIVMPREDFIDETDYVDWTSKVDTSIPIEILPMGELDAKKYTWTYKSDEDYYNKKYFDQYKEVYGTQHVNVESDFNTSEKRTEIIFSATPIADGDGNNKVFPRLFQLDESGAKSPMKTNIRCLYYGGLVNGAGTMYFNGTTQYYPALPFCGMVDNPLTSTIDLGFGVPYRIYWNWAGMAYTSANRYNVRYSKHTDEITDRDSKIVVLRAFLTEMDIKKFSFRRLVFIDGTYYIVNKIEDYDPQVEKPCKLILLKYTAGATVTTSSTVLSGLGGGYIPNGGDLNMSGNYGQNTGGLNNINYNQNTFVFGENNTVSP